MNTLIRTPASNGWNLVNDEFDNLFEGFFRPLRRGDKTGETYVPAMDITERDNEYVVHAEMPGVNKDAIDITLTDGVLTISAEAKYQREDKDGDRLLRQERRYGKFARSIRLGTQIDEKKVRANYKDGVLELVLPKAEEVKPRKISVA